MLVRNINRYMCVCVTLHRKYVPLIFLREYGADELRVNVFEDNTEVDIKKDPLISRWTENNLINI